MIQIVFLNTDSISDPVDEVTDEKASYLFGLSWYRLFFFNTDSTSDPVDEVTDGKASYLFGLSWYRLFFLNTDSTSDPVDEVTDEKASYLFGLSWYRLFFLNTDSTSDPVDEHRWESQLSFWVVMIQIVFFKYGLNIWSCWWTQMGKPAIFLGCHDTDCFF